MRKKVVIVSGSKKTADCMYNQLHEYTQNKIKLSCVSLEEHPNAKIKGDLIVVSSELILEDMMEGNNVDTLESIFICNRTINFDHLDMIVSIKKGSNVLFVNDVKDTAEICVTDLKDLGLDHVTYYPYYPEIDDALYQTYPHCDYVVTPGEGDKVPHQLQNVIDLGPRIIDVVSMTKLMEILELEEFQPSDVVKLYLKKIIAMAKKSNSAENQVELLKQKLRKELVSRGHLAKYEFSHIIGTSNDITWAKEKAKRLAKTDLAILLEGESGTGKELFASAIHNESSRSKGPFLAVNFSALPDELVESELFGYEEGAFTGAKAGGRIGLFELAEGGTIFLDEIGDISPKVQTKLLRVLQEKEIMPVGGSRIKKVDIRVIAATNKNLQEMVKENKFRADLYYRIKIGYVHVPPLRKRIDDLEALFYHFVLQNKNPKPSDWPERLPSKQFLYKEKIVEPKVMKKFMGYNWYGNIRELEGLIKYSLAVKEGETIKETDLPSDHFFEWEPEDKPVLTESIFKETEAKKPLDRKLEKEKKVILTIINALTQQEVTASRNRILVELEQQSIGLSPAQLRNRMKILCDEGLIYTYRGKNGSFVTQSGLLCIEK